jgi:hypothetical protein
VERLASAKEDLSVQLRNKDAELADVKNMAGLLAQCNLDATPTVFPQCTVGSFYKWVSSCFDLVAMNTKIFGELGYAVEVCTLAYSMCSLVPADRPSSEKNC